MAVQRKALRTLVTTPTGILLLAAWLALVAAPSDHPSTPTPTNQPPPIVEMRSQP